MKARKLTLKVQATDTERRRQALVAAGIAPSLFAKTPKPQVHRDKKKELKLGKVKHRAPWAHE